MNGKVANEYNSRKRRVEAYHARRKKIAEEYEKESQAKKLAWEVLVNAYPPLPRWLLRNACLDFQHGKGDIWIIAIHLYKKLELKPGQSWERQSDGSKMLVSVHPETGEKWFTLHYTVPDADRILICKAEVNIVSRTMTFVGETDWASLDPNRFELHYEDDSAVE